MRAIIRFLLRIPYVFYWVFTKKAKSFEGWLMSHGLWRYTRRLLKDLKIIVPNEYREFLQKYPAQNPFGLLTELAAKDSKEPCQRLFYHYEDGKIGESTEPLPPVTVTIKQNG